ncbi:MAG: hypothetical protein PVTTEEND_002088 [Candidatus Fervidibacter sp.]
MSTGFRGKEQFQRHWATKKPFPKVSQINRDEPRRCVLQRRHHNALPMRASLCLSSTIDRHRCSPIPLPTREAEATIQTPNSNTATATKPIRNIPTPPTLRQTFLCRVSRCFPFPPADFPDDQLRKGALKEGVHRQVAFGVAHGF